MTELRGRVLVDGDAEGPLLRVTRPLSLWGGVDPDTGLIVDPNQETQGQSVTHRVLAIPATVGSSSSSAVILELLRNGKAPSALLLGNVDAILTLGVIVGRELGYATIPVSEISREEMSRLPAGEMITIGTGGVISAGSPG